jgi:hypothetical protein
MNKIILILAILTTMSCLNKIENNEKLKVTKYKNNVEVESIMGMVQYGLSKVKLNDSTTILIYSEPQTCSIIKIK